MSGKLGKFYNFYLCRCALKHLVRSPGMIGPKLTQNNEAEFGNVRSYLIAY